MVLCFLFCSWSGYFTAITPIALQSQAWPHSAKNRAHLLKATSYGVLTPTLFLADRLCHILWKANLDFLESILG